MEETDLEEWPEERVKQLHENRLRIHELDYLFNGRPPSQRFQKTLVSILAKERRGAKATETSETSVTTEETTATTAMALASEAR